MRSKQVQLAVSTMPLFVFAFLLGPCARPNSYADVPLQPAPGEDDDEIPVLPDDPPTATPTLTPTPLPTATPETFDFQDPERDTVDRNTGAPYDDPPADIVEIKVMQVDDPLGGFIQIKLKTKGGNPQGDYSYALVVYMEGDNGITKAFLWETHDGETSIGEIDPVTFGLIQESAVSMEIEQGSMLIEFPLEYLQDFWNADSKGTIALRAESFHMKSTDSVFSGDTLAGPYVFPESLIPPQPVP